MSTSVSQSNPQNTNADTNQQDSLRFPRAILSVSREEFDGRDAEHQPLSLAVKKGLTDEEGELPSDLHGSVFIISAAGNAASEPANSSDIHTVLPSKNGWTSILNGDGMVYRLDFNQNSETNTCESASLLNRFLHTPSFFADRITSDPNPHNPYSEFKFLNWGLARISPSLGMSEQVSTAFLPMPFPGSETSRLLATWDVGRPYEIDPDSLKVIAPVGFMKQWEPVVENLFDRYSVPFPQSMSSAHPCFDPETGEMFTINIVKSLYNLVKIFSLGSYDFKKWAVSLSENSPLARIVKVFVAFCIGWIEIFLNIGRDNATYLVRWDGGENLKKWKITYKGFPVKIKSTMHQMGLSKDYIILTETAFKLALEDFIPYIQLKLRKKIQKTKKSLSSQEIQEEITSWIKFIRKYLTFPQSPDTKFYIVPRARLNLVESGGSIEAQRFIVKGECNHYLVDYNNPNDKITVHAALNKAADAAEFIHKDDTSPFSGQEPAELAGMFSNTMAVNRPAIYVVDGPTGIKEKEEVLQFDQSENFTWSIGLYAYRDDLPTQEFEDIYWLGFGAWQDIQTQFIYDLYQNYVHREMPLDDLMEVTKQGVPTILCRLHIDRQANPMLSVADAYEIPGQYFTNSPQFVPRKGSMGSTDGYIICTAIYSNNPFSEPGDGSNPDSTWSNNSELWIFDASNLKQGPLCRLSHPKLNFSFTVHTTWLKDPAPSPTREYHVRKDFEELVGNAAEHNPFCKGDPQKVLDLFEEVYKAFEQDRKST
ncbi:MAG: carotenoid oxygenase family protein [Cyanobacteriota bacterium]|nr:carotenoid oxygenase family protein [Cyanobacteriota bacterium]